MACAYELLELRRVRVVRVGGKRETVVAGLRSQMRPSHLNPAHKAGLHKGQLTKAIEPVRIHSSPFGLAASTRRHIQGALPSGHCLVGPAADLRGPPPRKRGHEVWCMLSHAELRSAGHNYTHTGSPQVFMGTGGRVPATIPGLHICLWPAVGHFRHWHDHKKQVEKK